MTKVTVWIRYYPKEDCYKHNHYTKSWVSKYQRRPVPIVKGSEQESWKNYQWAKQYKQLVNGEIVD